jgi:hypothetical protein
MESIKELEQELRRVKEDAALVVHALTCSIQLIDALIAYMPEGSPMSPSVGTCKGALDQAMMAIRRRTER